MDQKLGRLPRQVLAVFKRSTCGVRGNSCVYGGMTLSPTFTSLPSRDWTTLCSIFRLRRLSLLGHVARVDRTVPAWKALYLVLQKKRFPSRPRMVPSPRQRTWMDQVKEDTGAPPDSLMCLAADRQAWRILRYGTLPPLHALLMMMMNSTLHLAHLRATAAIGCRG